MDKERFLYKIRTIPAIRFLCYPFLNKWRAYTEKRFLGSPDSQYLKKFKDIHVGKRCFIIGNGPSLQVSDLEKLTSEYSFGANKIYHIFDKTSWRPSYYAAFDAIFLETSYKEVLNIDVEHKFIRYGAKIYMGEADPRIHYTYLKNPFTLVVGGQDPEPISDDISKYVTTSGTVTCMNIQIAIYMGFKEIYLLGTDHSYAITADKKGILQYQSGIQAHFYETKGADSSSSVNHSVHHIDWSTLGYKRCKEYADEHGVKIYNATRGGKLEVFERVDFDSII